MNDNSQGSSKALSIIPNDDGSFEIYATRGGLEELIYACMKCFNSRYMYEDSSFVDSQGNRIKVTIRHVGDLCETRLYRPELFDDRD